MRRRRRSVIPPIQTTPTTNAHTGTYHVFCSKCGGSWTLCVLCMRVCVAAFMSFVRRAHVRAWACFVAPLFKRRPRPGRQSISIKSPKSTPPFPTPIDQAQTPHPPSNQRAASCRSTPPALYWPSFTCQQPPPRQQRMMATAQLTATAFLSTPNTPGPRHNSTGRTDACVRCLGTDWPARSLGWAQRA